MNQLRRTGIMLALVLALVVGVASVAPAAIEVEGDAYVGVFDKYLWRGFDLSGSQPVAQGGVDLSAGGFTLSYWSNYQLSSNAAEGIQSGEMNETDIILDYSFDINELVSASVGDNFYALEGLEDTHEAYFAIYLNTILAPAFTAYWDWDEAQETGLYFTAAVSHDIEVSEQLSLHLGAAVGYNQNSDFLVGDYSGFHNAELNLGLDYALTDQISLSPTIQYSTPLSDDAEDIAGIDDEMSAGLSVTFSF